MTNIKVVAEDSYGGKINNVNGRGTLLYNDIHMGIRQQPNIQLKQTIFAALTLRIF
jgi:hypothetical protein